MGITAERGVGGASKAPLGGMNAFHPTSRGSTAAWYLGASPYGLPASNRGDVSFTVAPGEAEEEDAEAEADPCGCELGLEPWCLLFQLPLRVACVGAIKRDLT